MSNNDIFKKLRVALQLTNEDIIAIMALVNFKITKSELGSFFRSDDHPNFKACGDQILRNFLNGLVIYKRGPKPVDAVQKKVAGDTESSESAM